MISYLKFLIIIAVSLSSTFFANAQQQTIPAIDLNYFRNPLDIKLVLAGTFGEIRANHFHSGIDIKTNQREGYPVYAVADGYISRLRVQIGGFGNAVYINHPNGITSVYGHLQKYNARLLLAMRTMQYKNQSFTQDFMLTPIEIPVKKGDIIAWSGNTGGSAGPHLHFELRNTKTEETINALTLGIHVPDHIRPVINGFYIYQIDQHAFNEDTKKKYFQTVGSNGNYSLNQVNVVPVSGEIGLGIMAYDQFDGATNHNGLFSTTIKLDGQIIYETVISKFSFDNTRAVNAYIDYPAKISSGRVIQKGFASPNPKVRFYNNLINDGLISLNDKEIHQIEYILKDYSGNESKLSFKIQSNGQPLKPAPISKGELMSWKSDHRFEKDQVKVYIPDGVLYDDLDFKYAVSAQPSYGASKIYHIHDKLTPIHDVYELGIKPDSSQSQYFDKMLIMNTETGSQGGEFKNGYVVASPKIFGNFYLRIDNIAPAIIPLNVKEGVNLSQQKSINFRISDNLSGIKSFNGYIDGRWVLFEYDYKNGKLWHNFDEKTGFGKHELKIVVTDWKDNIKTYSINFYR
ncbi:MAG: M23 family metallopeptidase [Pelobium sp.]